MTTLPHSLVLRSSEIILRDWREEDAPVLESISGDPDVCQFTSVPWDYSPEAARAWVVRVLENRAVGKGLALAITRAGSSTVVGNVNLVRFSDDGREAALGYWLVPAARGEGLAAVAARLLCDWGFQTFGLERIELAILPDNAASHRVASKLGAVNDGLRRNSHEADGKLWDMVIYSLYPPAAQSDRHDPGT